jgi:predicted SnoaL-like aldol condensation-catalyzing enzyme
MHHRTPSLVRSALVALGAAALLASTGVAAHAVQARPADMSDSRQQNITTVLTALQVVFTEHQIDQVDRYFAADFVQHSPLLPPQFGGREGLKLWLAGVVAAIPDLAYVPDPGIQPLASGDRVMVAATVKGTIQGDLPLYGIKGSGQHLQVSSMHVFRLDHGRIVEHWEVVDTGPLVRLAG